MTEDSALIDSNLLVYAIDIEEKEKHEKAIEFLEKTKFKKNLCISTQNLAEFHYIATNKIPKPISYDISREIIKQLNNAFSIVSYNEKTLIQSIQHEKNYKIHFWDALIAATMEENEIRIIYTENVKDFKKIPWIRAINPLK